MTEEAMKFTYGHVCPAVFPNAGHALEDKRAHFVTLFFPINDDVFIHLPVSCRVCFCVYEIVHHEEVRVR